MSIDLYNLARILKTLTATRVAVSPSFLFFSKTLSFLLVLTFHNYRNVQFGLESI